jgi:hypothetical protein
MNPKKEITSIQLPRKVMAALREYCEGQSKSLNEVICHYLGDGLSMTNSASLTDALDKHTGGTAGARKALQQPIKMGRPRGSAGKESDWCMIHDIARMLLDGETTYKIAKAMQITYMKARWIIKRDADQIWQQQRPIEEGREKKAENKARIEEALAERARQQYEKDMKAIAEGRPLSG